jgi:hypothetical protein
MRPAGFCEILYLVTYCTDIWRWRGRQREDDKMRLSHGKEYLHVESAWESKALQFGWTLSVMGKVCANIAVVTKRWELKRNRSLEKWSEDSGKGHAHQSSSNTNNLKGRQTPPPIPLDELHRLEFSDQSNEPADCRVGQIWSIDNWAKKAMLRGKWSHRPIQMFIVFLWKQQWHLSVGPKWWRRANQNPILAPTTTADWPTYMADPAEPSLCSNYSTDLTRYRGLALRKSGWTNLQNLGQPGQWFADLSHRRRTKLNLWLEGVVISRNGSWIPSTTFHPTCSAL